jgi:16S rRNA (cytidine1402-2'-O)-methyltransferase
LRDALSRLSPTEAAKEVAKALGLSRRELYQQALALRAAGADHEG